MARNRPITQNRWLWVKSASKSEHSHDFELQLLRFVRHPFRQGVQMQIEIADSDDGSDQHDADHDHQHIGLAGCGDEGRQMMGGGWMKGLAHVSSVTTDIFSARRHVSNASRVETPEC